MQRPTRSILPHQRLSISELSISGLSISAVLLALGAIALPLSSTLAQSQPNCKNPQTQLEMNLCAGERAKAADRQLNQVYQQVRARFRGQPSAQKLVDAQLAWIAFRDAECAFARDRYQGGSIAPMVFSNCVERLTKTRSQELKRYLEEGSL